MVFTITDIYSFFHVRIHNRDYASLSRWFWFSWVSVERNWLHHRRWFYHPSISTVFESWVPGLNPICVCPFTLVRSAARLFMACIKFAKLGNSLVLSPRRLLFTHMWLHIWTTLTLFSFASPSTRQIVFRRCLTPLLDLSLGFQSLITFRPPYLIFTGFLWLIAFILSCYS